jgi:hypothetical protein
MNVVLTGQDTLKINDTIMDELANGENVALTFPNELFTVEKGKNGVALYAKNEQGSISEMTCRFKRGGANDKFMNNILNAALNDFASFVLITGEFIKRLGDGNGNITNDTYFLKGGMISKYPETKANADGDVEQAVSVYTIKFSEIKIIKG